jgi:hypothetical protein
MTTLSRSKNVAQYMLQEFHRVQFSFIGKLHDSGKIPIIQMRPYCTSVHVHVVSYSASVHVHVVSYSAVRNRRLAFPINTSTSQAHRRGGLRAGVLLRRRHPAGPAGADASSGGGPRRHPRPQGGVRGLPPGDWAALHPGDLQPTQPQLQQLQQ